MAAVEWRSPVNGTWTTASDWSSGRVPGAADDVTIAGAGTFGITLSGAATVRSLTLGGAHATLRDSGSLHITGTLGLNAGIFDLHGGTLSGGTLVNNGGTFYADSGTLSGLTVQGMLTLAPPLLRFSEVTVTNGITLVGAGGTGAGTLNAAGYQPVVNFLGPTVLNNATIDIGGLGSQSYLRFYGGPVTFGSRLLITQTQRAVIIETNRFAPARLVENLGTVSASIASGYLDLRGVATFTNQGTIGIGNRELMLERETDFVNAGLISASGGAQIAVLSGLYYPTSTFTNSGSIVVGGAGSAVELYATSFTNLKSGTLVGGSFEVGAGGTLALAHNARVSVDSAGITLNGVGSVLQSLDTTTNKQVALERTLATIASGGTLAVLSARGFSVASGGTFHDDGLLRLGGGTFSAGSLVVGSGGTIAGAGTIVGHVSNAGLVSATGGTLTALGLSGVIGTTLASGSIEADARSTLELPNSITLATDAAGITLFGTASVIQSLDISTGRQVSLDSTLATIASHASLSLLHGRSFAAVAVGGNFSDAGLLSLNAGTFSARTLTIAGTLSGSGAVSGSLALAGTVDAAGGTLAITGAVSGAGRLTISHGGALSVTGSMTALGGLTFAAGGSELLALGSPAKSGTRLFGFAAGDTIDLVKRALAGVTWTQTSGSAGQLTLNGPSGAIGTLALGGSFKQANFALKSDGQGGTDIGFAAGANGSFEPNWIAGLGHR